MDQQGPTSPPPPHTLNYVNCPVKAKNRDTNDIAKYFPRIR